MFLFSFRVYPVIEGLSFKLRTGSLQVSGHIEIDG